MKRKFVLIWMLFIILGFVGVLDRGGKAEGFICGNYQYNVLEDGTAEITRYTGKETKVVVPSELNGHSVSAIGDSAFYLLSSIREIELPQGVEEIGEKAFAYCSSLSRVVLPDSLREIGHEAFYACTTLINVQIPEGVYFIGNQAFSYCKSMMEIVIPDSVHIMGINPFSECRSMKRILVSPDHPVYAEIDGVLFHKQQKTLICFPKGSDIHDYVIPQGIEKIGKLSFTWCESLKNVVIPSSVVCIEERAFSICTGLETVLFSEGLEEIGKSAFSECVALKEVDIPSGVIRIGDYAFLWCESLEKIILPKSLETIGNYAFSICTSLNNFVIPEGVISMGDNPFLACRMLKEIQVSEEQEIYEIREAALFNKEENKLVCYPNGRYTDCYSVPEGTESIGNAAFRDCSFLSTISIPASVVEIAENAFSGCELSRVIVSRESYAADWCEENRVHYTYPDANDWLDWLLN